MEKESEMEKSSKKSWWPLIVFVLLVAVGYLAYRWHQRHRYDNVRVGAVGLVDWPFEVVNSEPRHPDFHPQGISFHRIGCTIYNGARFIVVAVSPNEALVRYLLPEDLLTAEQKERRWNCPDGMLFYEYKRYLSDGIEQHDRWLEDHWEESRDRDVIRDTYYRSLQPVRQRK